MQNTEDMQLEITQLKHQLEQMQIENNNYKEQLDYLDNIISYLPGHVYWLDKNNVYLGCNDLHAHDINLKSRFDIINKTNFDMPWKDQAEKINEFNNYVISSGKIATIEESAYFNNSYKTFLSQKVPLKNKQDEIIGILGISVDITELKKTQEQLAESEITAKKEQEMRKTVMMLVGDIVHDLKTPIATIYTDAHILKELAPELNEVIKEARQLNSDAIKSIDDAQLEYVINDMATAQINSVHMMNEFIKATLHELSVAHKYQDGSIGYDELKKCSIRRVLENVMESYPRSENIIINQFFSYDFMFMGNSILMLTDPLKFHH